MPVRLGTLTADVPRRLAKPDASAAHPVVKPSIVAKHPAVKTTVLSTVPADPNVSVTRAQRRALDTSLRTRGFVGASQQLLHGNVVQPNFGIQARPARVKQIRGGQLADLRASLIANQAVRALGAKGMPTHDSGSLTVGALNALRGLNTNLVAGRTRYTQEQLRLLPHAQRAALEAQSFREGAAAGHRAAIGDTVLPFTGFLSTLAAQLGQEAAYNPAGAYHAITDPGGTAKLFAKGTWQALSNPLGHPGTAIPLYLALAAGGGSALARTTAAKSALAEDGLRAAITREGSAGGSLLHAPEPGTFPLYVKGGQPEAAGTVAGGQAAQPHGLVEGPRTAVRSDLLLSRNVLAREAPVLGQRARFARLQAKLDRGSPVDEPANAVARFVQQHFATESRVGGELRAARRVEGHLADAPAIVQQQAIKGLTRGQRAALGVLSIEGDAALANPAGVISRHIQTHEGWKTPENAAAHDQHITDLKLAQAALEKVRANPDGRESTTFLRALQETRALSRATSENLIAHEHLSRGEEVGRRAKIAALYGHQGVPSGSFYTPHTPEYLRNPARGRGGSLFTPRPGEYGMGAVQPGRYIAGSSKQFKGETVKRAEMPVDVGANVQRRFLKVNRLHAAEDFYGHLWDASTPTRESAYQVPIRSSAQVKEELKSFFAKLADHVKASPDEELALNKQELDTLTSHLDAAEHHGAGVGAKVEGVRWVDRRLLKDMGETSLRGPLEKLGDAVNNPLRAATLYLRPAYALNLVGNMGMQTITQGHLAPAAFRDAIRAPSLYGREDVALIDSALGNSRSRSYAVTTGSLAHRNQQLAETWNSLTDLWSRRSAFIHEARRAGYRTPEQVHDLLTNPRLAVKRIEVIRRANKNIVDYDSLTPVEKNTIRRLVYFYPWVSRGSVWALRALVEHPGKAYTLAQLGQIGADNVHRQLGPTPSWMNMAGYFPVGKTKGGLAPVVNPSSVNTFATGAQTGQALYETGKGLLGFKKGVSAGLSQILSPAAQAFVTAGGGDSSGQPGGLGGELRQLPQVQAVRRGALGTGISDRLAPWIGLASKTFPERGPGPGLGPLAAGGFWPRKVAAAQVNKQALKEQRGNLGGTDRVRFDIQQSKQQFMAAAKQAFGFHGGLPPGLVSAYNAFERRASNRVAAMKNGKLDPFDKLKADLKTAVQINAMSSDVAKRITDEMAPLAKQPGRVVYNGRAFPDFAALVSAGLASIDFGTHALTQAQAELRHRGYRVSVPSLPGG